MLLLKGDFFINMTKPNYERKALAIESGCSHKYRQFRYACYKNEEEKINTLYSDLKCCYDDDLIKESSRLYESQKKRVKTLKNKIKTMLSNGKCIFLTLTFKPDTLESTTPETRKDYVRRFLKENYDKYIANIDYGARNGREHYHAVCLLDNTLANFNTWHKYGAVKSENIWQTNSDIKISKYITKLTNHAIKETCKRSAIIYSR